MVVTGFFCTVMSLTCDYHLNVFQLIASRFISYKISSRSLVGLVATKSHACYLLGGTWLGLGSNLLGLNIQWQCQWRIWPYLVLWLACRGVKWNNTTYHWLAGGLSEQHNLPLAWHAARNMCAIGWVMIAYSSNCLISQEWLASIAEGDSINKRNFTIR